MFIEENACDLFETLQEKNVTGIRIQGSEIGRVAKAAAAGVQPLASPYFLFI